MPRSCLRALQPGQVSAVMQDRTGDRCRRRSYSTCEAPQAPPCKRSIQTARIVGPAVVLSKVHHRVRFPPWAVTTMVASSEAEKDLLHVARQREHGRSPRVPARFNARHLGSR